MAKHVDAIKKLPIVHFLLGISFLGTGLIVNLVQCILYFTLKLYSKQLYRKINYYLCYSFNSEIVFVIEWWSGTDCTFYFKEKDMEKHFGKEHALCIMNHSYELDFMIGWLIADRVGCLGNAKSYSKKEVQYIPTIGVAQKFSESIFLERNLEKDKIIIVRQITQLLEHPDPIWLLLYPEGTRFNAEKHNVSLEYAKENNLPQLKHHLNPRTKGFIASLPILKHNNVAIYDITVAFPPEEASQVTVTDVISGKTLHPQMVIDRIPSNQIPDDVIGQEKFMQDLFIRKDKLRDSFFNTGDFFTTSGMERMTGRKLKKRYYSMINFIVWSLAINCCIFYYLLKWLWIGEYLYFIIFTLILVVLYIAFHKFVVGKSKISSASSYGTTKEKKTG